MANKNLNKLQNLANQYNVTFQALYTAEAIAKGNLQVVHKALIGGKEYTCLQQYNNADLEKLFKGIADGTCNMHAPENTTIFSKDGETVSINGNRYNLFDIVKDMDMVTLSDMISNYIEYGTDWQIEFANKIRNFLKQGGYVQWLEYQYQLEYGETVDEYAERMGVGA